MFCSNCGKQISDESKFCRFCGFKFIDSKNKVTVSTQKFVDTSKSEVVSNDSVRERKNYFVMFIPLIVLVLIAGGIFIFLKPNSFPKTPTTTVNSVESVDKQAIENVKGAESIIKKCLSSHGFNEPYSTIVNNDLSPSNLTNTYSTDSNLGCASKEVLNGLFGKIPNSIETSFQNYDSIPYICIFDRNTLGSGTVSYNTISNKITEPGKGVSECTQIRSPLET